MRKQAYNEDIHGGLRLESVTPMVLEHVFHGVINVNIHMDKWWIASKKYNTYSVVPRKPYVTPGYSALLFDNPGLSKVQHLQRCEMRVDLLFVA